MEGEGIQGRRSKMHGMVAVTGTMDQTVNRDGASHRQQMCVQRETSTCMHT
jgi:hypothetical protein